MLSLQTLLCTCADLALQAGDILVSVDSSRFIYGLGVVNKDFVGFDPQTVADRRSEALVLLGLRQAFGSDLPVVGEEGGHAETSPGIQEDPARERKRANWWRGDDVLVEKSRISVWIDPLDGTKEYTEGRVEFCTVLVGIALDGVAVAGVIVEPFAGKGGVVVEPFEGKGGVRVEPVERKGGEGTMTLWWGMVGQGCFRSEVSRAEGFSPESATFERVEFSRRFRVGQKRDKTEYQAPGKMHIIVSRSRAGGAVETFVRRFTDLITENDNVAHDVALAGGCGYKIVQVLAEKADIYPFPCSGTSLWDTCAGDALVEAAGGSLLSKATGLRIKYDRHANNFRNDIGFVVTNDVDLTLFAINNVACAMDAFRTSVTHEFIVNDHLSKALDPTRVRSFATPAESLQVKRDFVGTVKCNVRLSDGRILEYFRFDPTNVIKIDDRIPSKDVVLFQVGRANFLSHVLPLVVAANPTNPLFSSTSCWVETNPNRRLSTVKEVLKNPFAVWTMQNETVKSFLEACSYLVLFCPVVADVEPVPSFERDATFLCNFHNVSLTETMEQVLWPRKVGWTMALPEAKSVEPKPLDIALRLKNLTSTIAVPLQSNDDETDLVLLRGFWETSCASLNQVGYCSVGSRYEDLAHLMLFHPDASFAGLRSAYHALNNTDLSTMIIAIKTVWCEYLPVVLKSEFLQQNLDVARRIVFVSEALCDELERGTLTDARVAKM